MNIYTIYKATNLINGKVYIGFDSNWPKRKLEHIRQMKYLNHAFHNAIKKYGLEKFRWDILYQSWDRKHTLSTMEPHFIEEYCSFGKNGYNMTLGGEGTNGYKRPDLSEYNRSQKGIKKNLYLKIINSTQIPCLYCDMVTTIGNHNRWHGDKCKHKLITEGISSNILPIITEVFPQGEQ
jgi:group I intron endonuclease